MLPTYPEHGFTLCKRYAFWFTPPHRGDVVVVRFLDRVYFLKRVVAEAGDTVEFRKGVLYVNGRAQKEPYVRYVSDWELPPRVVKPHHVYVVGDNRSMNMESHHFGQVDLNRIIGAPL